jgi:hypothetical protein
MRILFSPAAVGLYYVILVAPVEFVPDDDPVKDIFNAG